MLRGILISAVSLNLGLLLGRLSGFFREALVAANFGVTSEADIVVLMLTVPDLMVSLLMGGAMGTVLVPVFAQAPNNARTMLFQAMLIFGLIFCAITAGLNWELFHLISFLVPGFDISQIQRVTDAMSFVLWLVPLTVLAGTTTAFLHAKNKFAVASMGTLVVNISIIAGLYLVIIDLISFEHLAFFVITGGLLRLFSQIAAIRPSFHPFGHLYPLLLQNTHFARYCQAMISGSTLFMFPVIGRAFASFEDAGSVAVLNYSMRLIELPMSVCISFMAVILFPRLSQSFKSDAVLHRHFIRYGVQATLGLAVIASVMLNSLADEYTGIVYGYGDMSAANLGQVSNLISIGLLVLPLQGLAVYNTAIFNSRTDTRTPMIINAFGLLAYLAMLEFQIFGGGLEGIMWALVMSFAIILSLQLLWLKVDQLNFIDIYYDKSYLIGGFCATTLCVVLGHWIAALERHQLLKLFFGFLGALACLLVMAVFYAEIRGEIRKRLEARR